MLNCVSALVQYKHERKLHVRKGRQIVNANTHAKTSNENDEKYWGKNELTELCVCLIDLRVFITINLIGTAKAQISSKSSEHQIKWISHILILLLGIECGMKIIWLKGNYIHRDKN